MRKLPSNTTQTPKRSAFTLVELIVVITIVLIILAMTAGAVNYSLNAEKVGGAARQVQSYLAGARDRAIHAGEPRGVRFVRNTDPVDLSDPADPNLRTITSLLFVGPSEPWNEGNIRLERATTTATLASVVSASPDSGWFELAARDTLHVGLRVRIPNDRSGSWYTVIGFNHTNDVWPTNVGGTATVPPAFNLDDSITTNDDPYPLKVFISPPYRDPATNPAGEIQAFAGGGPNTYSLELPSVILPERPVLLPKGTVIDLDSSDVPGSWQGLFQTSTGSSTPAFYDVMFSPRGTVTGDAASKGVLHFYMTDLNAVALFRSFRIANPPGPGVIAPWIPAEEITNDVGVIEPIGDRALVSVFTQTGAVSSHPIDVTDADANGYADDPYYFAETGEVLDQ